MRVLYVEDDPMNRRVVRAMLEVAGSAMDEAEDAAAGLAMVEANGYEMILMDLRMPGMDGMEAMRQIRARGDEKAATPIIVVTADTAPDLKAACLAAGASDFIKKPVAMNVLFDSMAKVLAASDESMSF